MEVIKHESVTQGYHTEHKIQNRVHVKIFFVQNRKGKAVPEAGEGRTKC